MRRFLVYTLTLAFFFAASEPTLAQFGPFGGSGSVSAELATDPLLPDPYEEVTVSLRDAGTNLQGARIDWFIDGSSPIYDAANRRSVTLTAPLENESIEVAFADGVEVTRQGGR